jgi:hypothetical protein
VAERERSGAHEERATAAGDQLRGDDDVDRTERREAQGTHSSGHPLRDHGPYVIPARADRASYRVHEQERGPRDSAWTGTIDRLTGSDRVKRAIEGGTLPGLLDDWDREVAQFRLENASYLVSR